LESDEETQRIPLLEDQSIPAGAPVSESSDNNYCESKPSPADLPATQLQYEETQVVESATHSDAAIQDTQLIEPSEASGNLATDDAPPQLTVHEPAGTPIEPDEAPVLAGAEEIASEPIVASEVASEITETEASMTLDKPVPEEAISTPEVTQAPAEPSTESPSGQPEPDSASVTTVETPSEPTAPQEPV
jgi:hypothetical protein